MPGTPTIEALHGHDEPEAAAQEAAIVLAVRRSQQLDGFFVRVGVEACCLEPLDDPHESPQECKTWARSEKSQVSARQRSPPRAASGRFFQIA